MATLPTCLAPGQRYAVPGIEAWRTDHQLTILRVGRDARGLACVTYRCPNGQDVTGPAARFEAAVAAGEVVPVAAALRVACC